MEALSGARTAKRPASEMSDEDEAPKEAAKATKSLQPLSDSKTNLPPPKRQKTSKQQDFKGPSGSHSLRPLFVPSTFSNDNSDVPSKGGRPAKTSPLNPNRDTRMPRYMHAKLPSREIPRFDAPTRKRQQGSLTPSPLAGKSRKSKQQRTDSDGGLVFRKTRSSQKAQAPDKAEQAAAPTPAATAATSIPVAAPMQATVSSKPGEEPAQAAFAPLGPAAETSNPATAPESGTENGEETKPTKEGEEPVSENGKDSAPTKNGGGPAHAERDFSGFVKSRGLIHVKDLSPTVSLLLLGAPD